jgi:hypothetical protein
MRWFFSKSVPPFSRVLLVESGNRELFEELLTKLYDIHPKMIADLVTCYAGEPEGFRQDRGRVYRVTDYRDWASRKKFFAELRGNRYSITGIICSGEPIMTNWKWMLAFRLPSKVFVLNENCDYFWLDRGQLSSIRHFILFRAGLTGAGAVRTIGRLVLFPFTLLYLILFAAAVHSRRKLRMLRARQSP